MAKGGGAEWIAMVVILGFLLLMALGQPWLSIAKWLFVIGLIFFLCGVVVVAVFFCFLYHCRTIPCLIRW